LSAKDVFRDATAESRSQPFILGPLHKHDENQQKTDYHQDHQENRDEDTQPHKGRNVA
jgi:hypothetical protein